MVASKRWKCGECYTLHDFEDDAIECCQPEVCEVYVCDECDKTHLTEDDANECCVEEDANPENDIAELERRGQLRLIE